MKLTWGLINIFKKFIKNFKHNSFFILHLYKKRTGEKIIFWRLKLTRFDREIKADNGYLTATDKKKKKDQQ